MIKGIMVGAVQEQAFCDECGEVMEYIDTEVADNLPPYVHQCTSANCGAKVNLDSQYPRIVYVDITPRED